MNKHTINNTFTLEIPDRFQTLTEDDLRGMYRAGDPFKWGVRDTEKHVLIVALWKQYPVLLAWTLDLKAVVKKNEQLTGKAHAEHGYRLLDFFSVQAGDEKAEGYRFAYDKEGITQVSNSLLIKNGRTIYAFLCVGREENMEADKAAFLKIMETLKHA
ncbi:MAG: hypothetical protein IKH57_01855 [Clostridia bacterium]|nr:hypothetical protein [Clostridia bacterium]